ncbi:hypothetical protein CEP51_016201, partial [Fusarium floridanum]
AAGCCLELDTFPAAQGVILKGTHAVPNPVATATPSNPCWKSRNLSRPSGSDIITRGAPSGVSGKRWPGRIGWQTVPKEGDSGGARSRYYIHKLATINVIFQKTS